MCQLCAIKTVATSERWPKPLEPYKADIDFLVRYAHDKWTARLTTKTIRLPAKTSKPSTVASEPTTKSDENLKNTNETLTATRDASTQPDDMVTETHESQTEPVERVIKTDEQAVELKETPAEAKTHSTKLNDQPAKMTELASKTTDFQAKPKELPKPITLPSKCLIDITCTLSRTLDQLENDREKWWTSPRKRAQRQRLEADCDQRRLSDLHIVNNETVEAIEAMKAKVGLFAKWSLGINGGIEELLELGVNAGLIRA